jgi:hypothetical protein
MLGVLAAHLSAAGLVLHTNELAAQHNAHSDWHHKA